MQKIMQIPAYRLKYFRVFFFRHSPVLRSILANRFAIALNKTDRDAECLISGENPDGMQPRPHPVHFHSVVCVVPCGTLIENFLKMVVEKYLILCIVNLVEFAFGCIHALEYELNDQCLEKRNIFICL